MRKLIAVSLHADSTRACRMAVVALRAVVLNTGLTTAAARWDTLS